MIRSQRNNKRKELKKKSLSRSKLMEDKGKVLPKTLLVFVDLVIKSTNFKLLNV